MKIAICSEGKDESSLVANRFARADYFVIYNQEDGSYTYSDNNAKNQSGGAGAAAVKILVDLDCQVALSPQVGPKALDALRAFEVSAYNFGSAKTVKEAVSLYLEAKLSPILVAHNENHKK